MNTAPPEDSDEDPTTSFTTTASTTTTTTRKTTTSTTTTMVPTSSTPRIERPAPTIVLTLDNSDNNSQPLLHRAGIHASETTRDGFKVAL